jgi:hypothetical protein
MCLYFSSSCTLHIEFIPNGGSDISPAISAEGHPKGWELPSMSALALEAATIRPAPASAPAPDMAKTEKLKVLNNIFGTFPLALTLNTIVFIFLLIVRVAC